MPLTSFIEILHILSSDIQSALYWRARVSMLPGLAVSMQRGLPALSFAEIGSPKPVCGKIGKQGRKWMLPPPLRQTGYGGLGQSRSMSTTCGGPREYLDSAARQLRAPDREALEAMRQAVVDALRTLPQREELGRCMAAAGLPGDIPVPPAEAVRTAVVTCVTAHPVCSSVGLRLACQKPNPKFSQLGNYKFSSMT